MSTISKNPSDLTNAEIQQKLNKTQVIQLRVTVEEKETIKAAATKLGLTVTDYLVRIGTMTASKLD
jgi:uncharacterized protein (DUF1778 family)